MYSAVIVTDVRPARDAFLGSSRPHPLGKADPLLPLRPGAQNFSRSKLPHPEDGFEHRDKHRCRARRPCDLRG